MSLLSTSVWYYKHHRRDDGPLRLRIKSIAETRVRYGIERIVVLWKREGWRDNQKRIYRIYKEEGLNLKIVKKVNKAFSKQKKTFQMCTPAHRQLTDF
ncbi:IS3 family transposase [Sphingobacterium populi]|uniref:IS3 family transposase n=1 Tax=Sphingobacterium sp. CFCC 11742 TaxID=1775560 RepID=UPI00082CC55D